MSFVWNAKSRTDAGKGASRRLRHAGLVPGIIYGADKAAISVTFDHNELNHHLDAGNAVYNSRIQVNVEGGASEEVVIKDIQRHPFESRIMHIDLQRIDENRKIIKRVPISFEGSAVAPGVKSGALMTFFAVDIEVRCLPKDLPEVITIDVSGMMPETSIRMSDLVLPEGVEITALLHGSANYDQSLVGVGKTRAAK